MKTIFLLITLISISGTLCAQAGIGLKVSGEVTTPLQLSLQEIAAMPHQTAYLKQHDKVSAYSGVAVRDIFAKAGVPAGKQLRGENLSRYLLIKCADGYEVIFSLAEMDSAFTDNVIILADSVEGKPIELAKGPLRLIVPGDKKPARSCQQVVEFVIRYGKD